VLVFEIIIIIEVRLLMVSDDKYNDPSPLHATLRDNLSVNSLELYGNLYRQNIIIIIILVTTTY
jgi:hypothetical protein